MYRMSTLIQHSMQDSPSGGDTVLQYLLYCGNQCPVRLITGVTVLYMGAASLVCGGGGGSILEVLFNLQPKVFRLCGKLMQHNDTVHRIWQGVHQIGLIDWLENCTKCKKVRSCDTCTHVTTI